MGGDHGLMGEDYGPTGDDHGLMGDGSFRAATTPFETAATFCARERVGPLRTGVTWRGLRVRSISTGVDLDEVMVRSRGERGG